MRKFTAFTLALLIALCASTAMADYRVTANWVDSADPFVAGYQILLDGAVMTDVTQGVQTGDFTVADLTGQSVVLRTLGNTGGPADYIDSSPIVLIKLATPATGFGISVTWE